MAGLTLLSAIPAIIYTVIGVKVIDEVGQDLAFAMGDVAGQQTGIAPLGGSPEAIIEGLGSAIVTMAVLGIVLIVVTTVGFFLIGLKLRQRRWWTFCYLAGWGECLMFPFGTILGVFTIVVLSRPGVKRSFGVD